ncbi:hypothetical protein CYMTET_29462 [Cymbomonas tetramitiformis]|uniref:DUF4291 domain-containing protein n=1 Tax=Cymbomonas tetramitiformis TaxID=36881 RepID=A0AAE0FMF8_9CHLO|nr:hypothetical protein CYMTET_29462 [Cymbomonas tetramitiformis]|eukprot:gene5648-6832_t
MTVRRDLDASDAQSVPARYPAAVTTEDIEVNTSGYQHGLDVQVLSAEWDEDGVYFYQAFNDQIADWAIENQRFGGPGFNPTRMTWIKPSFAWMLYRAGYGRKHNQNRILKVKIPHVAVAELLANCQCRHGGGGSHGRVQWDPARDIMAGEGRTPRMLLKRRAIQIGLKDSLSKHYVDSVVCIEDVTALAHRVQEAHQAKNNEASGAAMSELLPELPVERPYMPQCSHAQLVLLGLLPGETALAVSQIGRGKVPPRGAPSTS